MAQNNNQRCIRCGSARFMHISAKCNDLCSINLDNVTEDGYVPNNVNLGGGDYVDFDVCANCGQMVGTWPLPHNAHQETDETPKLAFPTHTTPFPVHITPFMEQRVNPKMAQLPAFPAFAGKTNIIDDDDFSEDSDDDSDDDERSDDDDGSDFMHEVTQFAKIGRKETLTAFPINPKPLAFPTNPQPLAIPQPPQPMRLTLQISPAVTPNKPQIPIATIPPIQIPKPTTPQVIIPILGTNTAQGQQTPPIPKIAPNFPMKAATPPIAMLNNPISHVALHQTAFPVTVPLPKVTPTTPPTVPLPKANTVTTPPVPRPTINNIPRPIVNNITNIPIIPGLQNSPVPRNLTGI